MTIPGTLPRTTPTTRPRQPARTQLEPDRPHTRARTSAGMGRIGSVSEIFHFRRVSLSGKDRQGSAKCPAQPPEKPVRRDSGIFGGSDTRFGRHAPLRRVSPARLDAGIPVSSLAALPRPEVSISDMGKYRQFSFPTHVRAGGRGGGPAIAPRQAGGGWRATAMRAMRGRRAQPGR